ncbi:MAG TPA: hypothetical protein VEF53_15700, partial [Patescibacteria group bacterium]|nr:hypothetical protein [Patescibacteria group bacterium]
WLEYAYRLQIIHLIDEKVLFDIISKDDYVQTVKRLQIVISGNRLDFIEKYPELKRIVFNGILDSSLIALPRNRTNSSLEFLNFTTVPYLLSLIFSADIKHMSVMSFLSRYWRSMETPIFEFMIRDPIDENIANFSKSIRSVLDSDLTSWHNSIEPWDTLVENGRMIFNDCWSLSIISVISAGIKSDKERYEEFDNLSDTSISLCKRVRCARMKSGNVKYWEEQLENRENLLFKLLVYFTWATAKTIVQMTKYLSSVIDSLKNDEFLKLADGIKNACHNSTFNKVQQIYIINEISKNPIQDPLKYLLSLRFGPESKGKFICDNIYNTSGVLEETNELKLKYLIEKYLLNTSDETILSEIKNMYSKIRVFDDRFYYFASHQSNNSVKIPYETAKKIMIECKKFPKVIAIFAEKSCRIRALEQTKPVGEIARKEKWFE